MTGARKQLWIARAECVRWLLDEWRDSALTFGETFPAAFAAELAEVLSRFETRLERERISAPVVIERPQGVKPQPEPDSGRGVFLSGQQTAKKGELCQE